MLPVLTSSSPTAASGDFDRVVAWYDPLAGLVFGGAQRRAQRAALAGLPPGATRVLIVGGGTGWVLTEVLRRRPLARVLYLEASRRMLARSQARLGRELPQHGAQVQFRLGTEADLPADYRADALITFFLLDCFEPAALGPALRRLNAARAPGAPWLLADFRPPTRTWQRLFLSTMYRFFQLTASIRARALPDLGAQLRALGLRPSSTSTWFGSLMEGSVWTETAAGRAS